MELLRANPNGQFYVSSQSNKRISEWNQVARGVAGRHNVTVVDVENTTVPYIRGVRFVSKRIRSGQAKRALCSDLLTEL